MTADDNEILRMLRAAGLQPPVRLTAAITGQCNLVCAHCWVGAGEPASRGPAPAAALATLFSDFARLGGRQLCITGGEPLLHPDWLGVVGHACGLGFERVVIQTNALLVDDRVVSSLLELRTSGVELQVSLDGAGAATHDRVRGAGAFAATVAGLERLAVAGFAPAVTISFTEMKHNIHEFPQLLEWADTRGFGTVTAGTLVCGGRGASGKVVPPEPDQYLELRRRLDTDRRFRERYTRFGTMSALEWRAPGERRDGGCTFAATPYLAADGVLYPCVLCQARPYGVAGTLEAGLERVLADAIPLWSELVGVSARRAVLPQCRKCPGKTSCAGGCMGRAWASRGSLLAVDDRCAARRIIYQCFNSGHLVR